MEYQVFKLISRKQIDNLMTDIEKKKAKDKQQFTKHKMKNKECIT